MTYYNENIFIHNFTDNEVLQWWSINETVLGKITSKAFKINMMKLYEMVTLLTQYGLVTTHQQIHIKDRCLEHFLRWLVNIGTGNSLVPSGNKLLN